MGKPTAPTVHATPRSIVPLLPYQQEDVECPARLRWNCWARQTGKSFTKSLRRILRGLERGRSQIFLSAGERQSRELMAKARMHCQALKIAFDYYDDRLFRGMGCKQLEIVLPRGVRIIGLPANPQTARGFTGDVFLDEFAMHADDREIWGAMFPTLLRGGGELDVASTPKGCGNLFHDLKSNPRFSHSTLTLPDAIAQGLDVDAEEMRSAMADDTLYRQEFLCAFLDEATAFLTYEQIAGCVDHGLPLCPTVDELRHAFAGDRMRDLYVGVDIGRRRDLTVVWVVADGESQTVKKPKRQNEEAGRNPVAVLRDGRGTTNVSRVQDRLQKRERELTTVAVFEMAQAPFREQWHLLAEVLDLPNVRRCCIDAGGLGMQLAEQAVETFGSHRIEPIIMTLAAKSQIAGALRLAVEAGRIRIPDDDQIREDFHSLQRSLTAGGHFRLDAPRREGSHADRFWAAALAVHAAGHAAPTSIESLALPPVRYARQGAW